MKKKLKSAGKKDFFGIRGCVRKIKKGQCVLAINYKAHFLFTCFVMKKYYLFLLLFYGIQAKFYAGRIKPGKFEYPFLNGWMSTIEAKEKCEKDLACAGFTFKAGVPYLFGNLKRKC